MPSPGASGVDVLAIKSSGQINGAAAVGEIVTMKLVDAGEMSLQRAFQALG